MYRRTRGALVEQLGLEPSAELRALERAILNRDPELAVEPKATPRPPVNLPAPLTRLIGRERELAEAGEVLRAHRLVTLVGVGGSGKTRLAIELAAQSVEDFPDGVWWIPLQAVTDPGLVLASIAQTLQVSKGLAEHLRARTALIVLDNFEQVTRASPEIAALLAVAPGLSVLVTSRQPLHLRGEQLYLVPTLEEVDAAALFVERARAVLPHFRPREAVVEICRRLDCLPLAIELAAARTRLLSPEVLLERLGDRLPLLTGGPHDAPDRQRTLRATVDWSYRLLAPQERQLFARMAVFAGGCTLEAAEAVCDAELDTLMSLVDKNLLRAERHSMLETIREYALERLAESGEIDEVRRRHAEYFLARAELLSNVIVDALKAHRVPASSTASESRRTGSSTFTERSDRSGRDSDALLPLTPFPADQERYEKLDELGVRRIGQLAGLPSGAAGERLGPDGKPERLPPSSKTRESRLRVEAELELANFRSGLEWCIENALAEWSLRFVAALSWPWLRLDSVIEGRTWAERALQLPGEVDLRVRARALEAAGALTTYANELDRASELLTQSLHLFRQLEDRFWVGVVLDGLADLDIAAGRLRAARARYEECLALFSELADEHGIAAAQFGLAVTQRDLGDTQGARLLLASAVRTFRDLLDLPAVAASSHSLGDLELEDGNLDDAIKCYTESLSIARDAELAQLQVAHCLGGLAGVAASRGDIQRAGRLWGSVETFETSSGIKLQSPDRGRYELRIGRVTGAAFDAAVTVGRRLTLTEATDYALSPA